MCGEKIIRCLERDAKKGRLCDLCSCKDTKSIILLAKKMENPLFDFEKI